MDFDKEHGQILFTQCVTPTAQSQYLTFMHFKNSLET